MHTTPLSEPGSLKTPLRTFSHTIVAHGLTDEVRRYEVIRRTGELTRFDASKIQVAMTKAFLAVEGSQAVASRRIHDIVGHLTVQVMEALFRRLPDGGAVHIEDIQDHVELVLMRDGHHKIWERLPAVTLWRKMLGYLFETGHPWITFKDPCNLRYTNRHVGVVHSSNLCTEITLHTNAKEIAVCNLGSVNLAAHVDQHGLEREKLVQTIATAMRMLDNVIDINYYAVPEARNSNLRHRPVGLGLMGFQDSLYTLGISYASAQAVEFADRSMEMVAYYAIKASTDLAEERGRYATFAGSLWSQGILPIDSIALLRQERGRFLEVDTSTTLDWDSLRERVQRVGMRHSNCLAIAPTATIANICGVSSSIEPTYQNLFVKSNLSGEFTVINPYLVRDLKALGLWDAVMVNDLKYFDGSVQSIDRIPPELKQKYAGAFEIDPRWLVEAASRRQKWLDQSQSLNLYVAEPSGSQLDNLYKLAWVRGLKTTYYLRTLGATHLEKANIAEADGAVGMPPQPAPLACAVLEPDCEACQ